MQTRNLIWFATLSILIMIGWSWLQNQIWPPKPRADSTDKAVQVEMPRLPLRLDAVGASHLLAGRATLLGGVLDELRLGQDLLFPPPGPRPKAHWDNLTEDQQSLAVWLVPSPNNLELLPRLALHKPAKTEEPSAQEVAFGGEKFHLQGSFTTRGAGVRKVTLNKFDAANWVGEPAKGKLELIPDDPVLASFLMYHFPATAIKLENPVLTLGDKIWDLDFSKEVKDEKGAVVGQEVRFSTDAPEPAYKHLRILKTYTLGVGDYHLRLILEFHDRRDTRQGDREATKFRYQIAGAHGLPIEGTWYTGTYRDSVIGVVDSSGTLVRTKEEAMRVSVKEGGEAVPPRDQGPGNSYLQYAGIITQYFGAVLVVDNEQAKEVDKKSLLRWARPIHLTRETAGILKEMDSTHVIVAHGPELKRYLLLPRVKKHLAEEKLKPGERIVISHYEAGADRVATWIRPGQSPRSYLDDLTVSVNSEPVELRPGDTVTHQFLLYHGPVKTSLLGQFSGDKHVDSKLVDRYTDTLHLNTLTDYRSAGPFGAFSQTIHFTQLLIFVTGLMHKLLYVLHFLVGSYGLTIILLTVLVRGLMFPISRKQAYFSVKMQEMAPELKKIKERYPTDRKAQMEATSALYRQHNVNPLGSCLPLFMQMPIFLGLYYALQESIHFRLAEFAWIKNLAAPDMLLWWTEKIPYVSDPDNLGGIFYLGPFLNLLPLIAVSLMIVQQKIMTPPPQDEQQEMQQKMMKYMMVFFGIMFYKVASGLCIYFISSSLWGLAERRFLPKKKSATQLANMPGSAPGKGGGPPVKLKGKGKALGKKEEKPNGTVQKVKDWWAEVLKQAKKK